MRKFRRRKRGEMIAMVLTSVFVLGALTVTGIYIKNRNTARVRTDTTLILMPWKLK